MMKSLPIDAWKDEFKDLKTGEYGTIQSGKLPFSYWGSMLILVFTDRSIDSPTQKKKEGRPKEFLHLQVFLFLLHFYPTIQKVLHGYAH